MLGQVQAHIQQVTDMHQAVNHLGQGHSFIHCDSLIPGTFRLLIEQNLLKFLSVFLFLFFKDNFYCEI